MSQGLLRQRCRRSPELQHQWALRVTSCGRFSRGSLRRRLHRGGLFWFFLGFRFLVTDGEISVFGERRTRHCFVRRDLRLVDFLLTHVGNSAQTRDLKQLTLWVVFV